MRRTLLSGGSTRNASTLFWSGPSSSFFLSFSFYLDIPFDGVVPCCVQSSKEYFTRNKAKCAWLKNDNNKGVEAVLKFWRKVLEAPFSEQENEITWSWVTQRCFRHSAYISTLAVFFQFIFLGCLKWWQLNAVNYFLQTEILHQMSKYDICIREK